MKNSFVLYTDYLQQIELLTNEQRGVLLTAIMKYASGVEMPDMDGITLMAFSFIKANIDKDNEKYERTVRARQIAGAKGGNARHFAKQNIANEANANFAKQNDDNDNDNGNDNDNDNDNDNESENVSFTSDKSLVRRTDVQRVVNEWNSLERFGIKPIRDCKSGTKRYESLIARIRQYGEEDVLTAIRNIEDSRFLRGESEKGWVITFDWFVKPNNFIKVLEGNYTDRGTKENRDRLSVVDDWLAEEANDEDGIL